MRKTLFVFSLLSLIMLVGAFAQLDSINNLFPEDMISSDEAAALPIFGGLMAMLMGIIVFVLIFAVVFYIYMALALSAIAKRTNTPSPWLAWIPIGNVVLMLNIARLHWAFIFLILLSAIPVVGGVIITALFVVLWWKISEKVGRSGALSLLMLLPIANLVFIGILAWGKSNPQPTTAGAPANPPVPDPQKQRILEYANSARNSGKTREQILADLKNAGWPPKLVDETLRNF